MEEAAMIDSLRALTQEQRQSARKSARNAVICALGSKPTRQQFTHTTISRYPLSVIRLISLLCMVLLLAAFTPLAIRLYHRLTDLWTSRSQ
jgi:1,4-dihydroxy-2-naphthoate octaprenyltransferase